MPRDAQFQLFGGGKAGALLLIPYAQHLAGYTLMVFQIRTRRRSVSHGASVEKRIHALAPQLPIFQVQTLREALYSGTDCCIFQIGATLTAMMGGLGLTLAVIGLYGVVSYAVSRRVHEIGVRMALGASRTEVFKMIYRQSVVIVALGLGIGLALALGAARAVGSVVVVSAWDPVTYLVVCYAVGDGCARLLLPAGAPRHGRGAHGGAARGLSL